MFRTLKTTLPLAAALMLASAPAALAQNLLIRGGTIHTGDEAQPTAEVVAVRDGRIAYVGAANGAPSAEGLEVVDLKGAALFPGFTDGHAHLDGIGWRELTLNLEGSASVAEAAGPALGPGEIGGRPHEGGGYRRRCPTRMQPRVASAPA